MPIKFGISDDIPDKLFILDNGEYKELGNIKEVEMLTDSPTESEEFVNLFYSPQTKITGKMLLQNFEAFQIYITTGNNLYLKFPKKLRRRRRRG